MSAVFADRSAREAFQVLLRKRKLQSMGLAFLQNKQKQPNESCWKPGDVLHKNADSGVACEPGAPGATAASGEPSAPGATAASGEQDREQGSPSTGAAAAAPGEQDREQGSPSTGAAAAAPGAAAASGEQDREQGSPSTGAEAAAKNIVLSSFWQEMTKILEDHDSWISMQKQELKKYSLSAHTDPQLEADAGEVLDVFNDNDSWEPPGEFGGLELWQEDDCGLRMEAP